MKQIITTLPREVESVRAARQLVYEHATGRSSDAVLGCQSTFGGPEEAR